MKRSIILPSPSSNEERVLVRPDLGGYYKEFLNSIPGNSTNFEGRIKSGVGCVVWGAFYLEAAINDTILKILEDGVHGIIRNKDMLWVFVEKANTERKLEFILDVLMEDEKKKKLFATQVKNIFKLRNRLAHYKELPREVKFRGAPNKNREPGADDISAKIDAARKVIPDIANAITSISVHNRRKTILEIGGWIENAIYDYYKERT